MDSPDQTGIRVLIAGRVQGVGFRYFAARVARDLGLKGYVLNRWDGRVEVEAEGDQGDLQRLVASLKEGPPGAYVDRVEVQWGPFTGKYHAFQIRFSE